MFASSKLCNQGGLYEKALTEKRIQVIAKRINSDVLSKFKLLKNLLKEQDTKCWEIGDLCIDLMDNHYIPLRVIAQNTNYSRARICHFHLTARVFPPDMREGYTFQDSLTARQVGLRLPRLDMSPAAIRDMTVRLRNKTPRQVKAYFLGLLFEKERNLTLAQSAKTGFEGEGIINNCHNSDWREVMPKLPDKSVKIFIADPPFCGYKKVNDGAYVSYRSQTSGMRTDCDCNTTSEAFAVTLPLFELCMPKLSEQGVLLLFQRGGKADRIEILQEAQKWGWECAYALTWRKGLRTSTNMNYPYRICSERILVFCRGSEVLGKGQNGMPTSDILDFPTETQHVTTRMEQGSMEVGDHHMFQKPQALMEFLIGQHSYPNELVCSVFGCSGVDVLASIQLNRQWVYIESNPENFMWGSQKIQKALKEQSVKTG